MTSQFQEAEQFFFFFFLADFLSAAQDPKTKGIKYTPRGREALSQERDNNRRNSPEGMRTKEEIYPM